MQRFLYLSTYEVSVEEPFDEKQPTQLDTLTIRNCYTEIKRLCESLCCAYSTKYGFGTCVARLILTFGEGAYIML
uniref:NAD-dependent epimerase/dehydratase family protein n=1 Tax=Eisenbergiella sp. TaxID=1924109 RepID=UPI003AB4201F